MTTRTITTCDLCAVVLPHGKASTTPGPTMEIDGIRAQVNFDIRVEYTGEDYRHLCVSCRERFAASAVEFLAGILSRSKR
jgi:hypothetical protein